MLRGYRGIVAALGLILAAHHPNVAAQPKQPAAQERSADALESIATRYNEQAERAERSPEGNPCQPGDDQRNSDLCAQWKAADAAADSAWWAARGTWISGISGLLVILAIGLAFQSNWIARDTAKRQLRAYLNITSLNGNPFGVGTTVAAHFTVTNSGQTPAHDVITNVSLCKRMNPVDLNSLVLEPLETSASKLVVAAGQPIFSFAEIAATSKAEFDAFHAGQSSYFVYGHIQYRDVFGEKWVTLFRHSLKANGSWEVCAEGNDAT